jgi:replicative DNA helicase
MTNISVPQALDAEEALLGAVLIDPAAYDDVAPTLEAGDFFLHKHRWIWDAITVLAAQGRPVDLVTIGEELERHQQLGEVGGTAYLTRLLEAVPSSLHAEAYADLVRRAAQRRALLEQAAALARDAYDPDADPQAVASSHARALEAITAGSDAGEIGTMGEAVQEWYSAVEQYVRTGAIPGLTCGYPGIDAKTLGMKRQELLILAARPSMGKTSLAAQMSVRQAAAGLRVGVFTLEGSKRGWVEAAGGADLGLSKQSASADDLARLADKCNEYHRLPLAYYERGYSSMAEIERGAARLARELGGLDVLWLDHLGYIDHLKGEKSTSLPYLIGQTTKRLARLAKDYDAAVVVLCQLSRASARAKEEPALVDLRDSGEIEQDARQVWFIHRPGYYEDPEPPAHLPQPARLLVRKNHEGPTGRIDLVFVKNIRRFAEVERRP